MGITRSQLVFMSLAILVAACGVLASAAPPGGSNPPPNPEIAFVDAGLRVMNADGSNVRTVVGLGRNDVIRHPCWSPDGLRLAFFGVLSGARGIWTVNLDGSNLRLIVAFPSYATLATVPDWSPVPAPDGTYRIAFSMHVPAPSAPLIRKTDVFVVTPDGAELLNVTGTEFQNEFYACWSSDASMLFVQRETNQLIAVGLGSDEGALIALGEAPVADGHPSSSSFSWVRSGGGTVLCYSTNESGRFRVVTLDVAASSPPQVLTQSTSGEERWASFGPGDQRLVFCRSGSGSTGGIFTINANGTGETRIASRGSDSCWRRTP